MPRAAAPAGASAKPGGKSSTESGDWEITAESELALERGLEWLARNQGPQGNWDSDDLGLVSTGVLAFLAAGHMPGRGKYGEVVDRALKYVVRSAKPSGLLNISGEKNGSARNVQRDMYNHGLSTFVLGQGHGMTNDPQIGKVLDLALKFIYHNQCRDGGWRYEAQAEKQLAGSDLSLAVMQAKAIRSAVDSGLEVPEDVIRLAIRNVQLHYSPKNRVFDPLQPKNREGEGQFTYGKHGSGDTVAMAAAGVVCLQEFGEYGDWRIEKNMAVIRDAVLRQQKEHQRDGHLGFDFPGSKDSGRAYTLYYVGQALYQVGGENWRNCYGPLRDRVTRTQIHKPQSPAEDGCWYDTMVGGKPGQLYGTAVACFILAMPNRYLPILQEGKIEQFRKQQERRR